MRHHQKYTRTAYEFTVSKEGQVVYTIWMQQRRPSLNKLYRAVCENFDRIKAATNESNIVWNGDGTITAGAYTGQMTGRTLLEARGYYA